MFKSEDREQIGHHTTNTTDQCSNDACEIVAVRFVLLDRFLPACEFLIQTGQMQPLEIPGVKRQTIRIKLPADGAAEGFLNIVGAQEVDQ